MNKLAKQNFKRKYLSICILLVLSFIVPCVFASTDGNPEERTAKNDDPVSFLRKWGWKSFVNEEEWNKQKEEIETLIKNHKVNLNDLFGHGSLYLSGNHVDEKLKLLTLYGLDLRRVSGLGNVESFSDEYFAELSQQGNDVRQLLMKSLSDSYIRNPEEVKINLNRIEKLLDSGVNPNILNKHGFLGLYGSNSEEKLSLLIGHGLDLNKADYLTINYFSSLSPDFIKGLIDSKKISIKKILPLVAKDRQFKELKKNSDKAYIAWLQEMSKLINENYGKKLINPATLDTALHSSIKDGDISLVQKLLFEFPELVNFANLDDETPLAMSYRLGNMDGVALCAYFGALKVYDSVPCNEITDALKSNADWKKTVLQNYPSKDFNLNIAKDDHLWLVIFGADAKELLSVDELLNPLIKHEVPIIVVGDGVAPLTRNAISAVVAARKDTLAKFKKINVLVMAHGFESNKRLINFQDIKSHHRLRLNNLFSEKTEDFFRIFSNFEKQQNINILMYACYGGLALQDALTVFENRSNVTVVTLSKPTLPTSALDSSIENMGFSADAEKLSEELANFPASFIDKYLINMYDSNNVVGIYQDGKISFSNELMGKIAQEDFLKYLDQQAANKLSAKTLDAVQKNGLQNPAFFEATIHEEQYQEYGPLVTKNTEEPRQDEECICLDKVKHPFKLNTELNNDNIFTTYGYCIRNAGDKTWCRETLAKPEFGLLQYHALRYLQLLY